MRTKFFLFFAGLVFTAGIFLGLASPASAAITQSGPPMFNMFKDVTVGSATVVPLARFMLMGDGTTALNKVGFAIRASSTMDTLAQIAGVALYKDSGAHPGFQPNEDVYVTGSYIANPATSTGALITMLPTAGASAVVPASNTEYFIVASTTATIGNIINGNAFDVLLAADYASTTPASVGVFTAPDPNNLGKKFILQKNIPVKISEVKTGSTGNAKDEFVELYNPNDFYIDLKNSGLALHGFTLGGGAANFALTFAPGKNFIAPYGYSLFTSATNYSGSVSPDATFDNLATDLFVANGGISLATSTNVALATSTKVDMLGIGTQPAANCENTDTVGANCAPALAETGSSLERIAQGYPNATSTNATMASGGIDAMKGNGTDRDDNSEEFVSQAVPNPQNSMSPSEMPFTFGFTDNSAPRVMGSYPNNNMTNVPADMPFIGFGFDKAINSGTLASASATTSVTLTATYGGANLCASVTYNPMPSNFEPSVKCVITTGTLASNTTYTFEVGTSTASAIRDLSGNRLDQDSFQNGVQSYKITFTTGGSGQSMTNMAPPSVISSVPFPGSFNIPTNITKFFITFSQTMNASTLSASTIKLYNFPSGVKTQVSWGSAAFSYNATTSILTIDGSLPTLADNTRYQIEITGGSSGVKSANGVAMSMPQWIIPFTTGVADNTAPTVMGVIGVTAGATSVPLNTVAFTFPFSDHIDVSTATSGAVTLAAGSATLPSAFSYNPGTKEGTLLATNLLPTNTSMTITVKGGSIKNVSGQAMGADYTVSFATENSNSDVTAPSIAGVNADDFGIAVTFNEAVNSTDATSLSNYSISAGGQTITLSSMAGHSITYNAANRTAKIQGVRMPAGSSFTVTASNIRDISGNNAASISGSGTVMSFAVSGGMIDPGMSSGGGTGAPPPSMSFTMGGGGSAFAPPANIRVMNNMTSASSTYGFELPISKKIPAGGKIVITFPSTSDFGLCCSATSSPSMPMLNDMNKDINGPGTGAIGIKTIATDAQAKTITLTTDTDTRNESGDTHDFLRFGLTGIKNPSIAKGADSSGYSLDIKTKDTDGATILESNFNVNPVYIGGGVSAGGATTTVKGQIFSAYDGTTGLIGVNIMLQSPILGQMPRSLTTTSGGNFSFTDLPANNDYFLFTEPMVAPTGTTTGYFGFNEPSPTRATSTSIITRNISLTATTSAVSLTIKLTASAATFGATEQLDIFAGGSGQFRAQTVTPGTGALTAATIATLSLPQQNGSWTIGVGPAMPKDGMTMGPPKAPTWVMPKPIELSMTGCPTACSLTDTGVPKTSHTFTIATANKTITGIVKDAGGTVIANAMIHAFSQSQGFGTFGQSDTAGKFSLNVNEGLYNVGAFFPGMGQSKEMAVEVTASANYVDGSKTASTGNGGANPLIVMIKKPGYTITGKVSDGSSYIANASVFAYRTDGPGNANAMTDSSGNYTLYVDNGAWTVNANVPGYGQMTSQSVTVAGANQSGINFAPSGATTYWSVMGTVFESNDNVIGASEGIANVMVSARASNSGAMYQTKTGADGTYTLRVPQLATSTGQYILDAFKPDYGKIALLNENLTAIPKFGIVATTTWNVRVNTRRTVTINFKDASGNFVTVPEAFIDLFDITKNAGNRAQVTNATSTSLQIADMSSTTVRVFIPSVPQSAMSYATDTAATTFYDAGKTILNVDSNEIIKVVLASAGTLRTVSGVVYQTVATSGNELKDAWIQVTNTVNGTNYGVSATSTNGYSISLTDGTYKIMAVKPGYTMTPQTLTVSGNATQNLVMTSAAYTISGNVTAGGSAAPGAFVRAEKVGGGFAVTEADASGNYSLSVDGGTWRVFAASEKYSEGAYSSNPITVTGSVSNINIALTSAANISSALATSDTFKDTSAGSFEDTTVNAKITVDSGALGQAGSDSYITAKETANFPDTPSVTVIANKAKDISAYSGDSKVTSLASGKKATVELTYTVAELATSGIDTPSEVNQLKVSTLNEQKEWEALNTIATYKDSSGNAMTAPTGNDLSGVASVTFTTSEVVHFSAFAITISADPTISTPSGLAIATPNSISGLSVSWGAVDGVSGYNLYRDTSSDGSFPLVSAVSGTSYSDAGLGANTTYYYKISAYNSVGGESSASAAVSARTMAAGGGGIIGSGGGGGSVPTPVYTVIQGTAVSSASSQAASSVSSTAVVAVMKPVTLAKGLTVALTKTLKLGSQNSEVKALQQALATDKTIYPEGKATGYYGPATKKAIQKFQKKYGIEQTGLVGPLTRKKIMEVYGTTSVSSSAQASSASTSVQAVQVSDSAKQQQIQTIQQLINQLLEQVKALQAKKN